MNANEFGKRLGIGVRVAGRIAQQRAQEREVQAAQTRSAASTQSSSQPQGVVESPAARFVPSASDIREAREKTHKITRAAGRGVGGFLSWRGLPGAEGHQG